MFSVVVPLYNHGSAIVDCLESVLVQSEAPLEVIVVDDGSHDGAADLIRRRFPHVRLIVQRNQGPGRARHRGIAAASGDWVATIDSDDLWLPDHLKELGCLVTLFPESGLVATTVSQMRSLAENSPSNPSRCLVDYFHEASENVRLVTSSTAAFNRNALFEIGGFSQIRYAEDLLTWARLATAYPVASSDLVTALYRSHRTGLVGSRGAQAGSLAKGVLAADASGWSPSDRLSIVSPDGGYVLSSCDRPDSGALTSSQACYVDSRIVANAKWLANAGEYAASRSLLRILIEPARVFARDPQLLSLYLPRRLLTVLLGAKNRLRRVEGAAA